MTEADRIEFEWSFTPTEYFEERTDLPYGQHVFVIDSGTVTVNASVVGGQTAWQPLANELHQILLAQFLAAQVLSHVQFTLSKPKFTRIRPDGGRDFFMAVEPMHLSLMMGSLDVVHTDGSGQVIHDSRAERIGRRRCLARTVAAYIADPVIDAMLRSYGAAVNDPGNELVHLYEIREAIAGRFGGEAAARAATNISASAWSRLGQLANSEPLVQGRHRGKHPGLLRDATQGELEEARQIGRAMIEAYVTYLSR